MHKGLTCLFKSVRPLLRVARAFFIAGHIAYPFLDRSVIL
jgi:hypothetical protein